MAVLVTAKTPNYPAFIPRLQTNAAALGVGINIVQAALPLSLEEVFKRITASAPHAAYVSGAPYLWSARKRVAELALEAGLPTTYSFAEGVEAGGLMSYGADTRLDAPRRNIRRQDFQRRVPR